jgi:phosphodiesterase/alkaline phosphatase D-like protein
VKVEVQGLQPGTEYFYLVADARLRVSTGRFSTAARCNAYTGLRFGVSGDWRGELAPYPSISNAEERELDFFVSLGDTIYADFPSPVVPKQQAENLGRIPCQAERSLPRNIQRF